MASTSETGHAKNVANFEDLISFCIGYKEKYVPSREALTVANLQSLYIVAGDSLTLAKNTKVDFDKVTNSRQGVFEGYKPFSTRVLNALASSGATKQTIADATTINKKIQGIKASSTKKDAPRSEEEENNQEPKDKSISVSQQSYDSIIDHFSKYIILLKKEALYNPNEADLTIAALEQRLADMRAANSAVINSFTAWSNALINRDTILYHPLTGLVDITKDVKKYVKSVFNATDPRFKQINGIEFKVIKAR